MSKRITLDTQIRIWQLKDLCMKQGKKAVLPKTLFNNIMERLAGDIDKVDKSVVLE